MSSNRIQKLRARIEGKIKLWEGELEALRSECEHPNATSKPGANTGNWDRNADSYWTSYTCPDCGKKWTIYHE